MDYYKFNLVENLEFIYILNINSTTWKPKFKILTEYDLIVVQHGEIEVILDDSIYIMNEGDYILAHPNQNICIKQKNTIDTIAFILHFNLKSHKIINNIEEQTKENISLYAENISEVIIAKTSNCLDSNVLSYLNFLFDEIKFGKSGYKTIIIYFVKLILNELYRLFTEKFSYIQISKNFKIHNEYYKTIINFLHNNYNKKITSCDIETLTNLNYDYINNMVKHLSGKTIMEILCNLRISVAMELIRTTNFPIKEIGQMCGFSDSHYFSRKFKQIQGISPTEYKQKHFVLT